MGAFNKRSSSSFSVSECISSDLELGRDIYLKSAAKLVSCVDFLTTAGHLAVQLHLPGPNSCRMSDMATVGTAFQRWYWHKCRSAEEKHC